MTDIAIIGAGNVGRALAAGWARHGHAVCFAVRDPAGARTGAALDAVPGARAAPIAQAVAGARVVVLATPWAAAEEALRAAGDFAGRPLLDASNPIAPGFALALGHDRSGGEQVQAWATGARVVKIFNSTGWENMAAPVYPAGPVAMPYCGDDADAKAIAASLAAELGFDPLDLGALSAARLLEPWAMVWIRLAIGQKLGRDVAFGLMRR